MKPILFSPSATSYSTGGSGRLSDAISCAVTEELNGSYELELRYPANGIRAAEIAEGCQLYVTHDESGDRQPFRVYKKTDTIDGVFAVYARHISGDLSRIPVMPFAASGVSAALAGLASHAAVPCPFVFETDVTTGGGFALTVPTSAKAALGSGEGSILGVFGGEVEYNNRTVTLLSRRGTDTGVVIQYGKNMTGLEVVSEASAAYNAVVPFCKTQEGTVVCNPPVVYHGDGYTDAVPLDLSDAFDFVPTPTQLETAALEWLNDHQPWMTERAINVSFVQLRQTTEYANFAPLERVMLGDGLTVRHTALGVNAQFRVVKTVYDVLQERYIELTLGRETQTVAAMISELVAKIQEARDIAQEIANGTYGGGTFISGQLIYAPEIYGGEIHIGAKQGGGYNFNVDPQGNIETAGTMTAVGHYAVKRENGNTSGYMGRASGYDGSGNTYGVALCAPDTTPDNLNDTTNCYIIVTTAGVRMQAKGNSLWVGSGGAFWGQDMLATKGWVEGVADDVYQAAKEYADSLLGGTEGS